MEQNMVKRAAELLKKNGRRKRWHRALTAMAAVVVFATSYMMILPAITLSAEQPQCGMEEHAHTDACYEMQLVCGLEESDSAHTHGEGCYTQQKTLTCTLTEGEGHAHSDSCYGNVCGLEETAGHTHTDECFTEVPDRVLTCTEPEGESHTHSDSCYTETYTFHLICGQEEVAAHTHSESCTGLICGQQEQAAHTHSDACYTTENVLSCTEPEGHVHSDACYEKVLVCQLPEHAHTDECYPETEEPEQPQEPELVCTVPEHVHEEGCYDADGNLTCTMEEHTHTEECYGEAVEIPEEDTPLAAFPEEVPEGYVEYTFENEEGLTVRAMAPENAFAENVELYAQVLAEDSEEYQQAQENLDKAEDVPEYTGMAAMDIRFVAADSEDPAAAEEIEPDASMGPVYVQIDAQALLPEDVDASTLAVQHHVETTDGGLLGTGLFEHKEITVETVADSSTETGEITAMPSDLTAEAVPLAAEPVEEPTEAAAEEAASVAMMDVEAKFGVESFSTFTITWDNWYRDGSVTFQAVDTNSRSIDYSIDDMWLNVGEEISLVRGSKNVPNIPGYTFQRAAIGGIRGEQITNLRGTKSGGLGGSVKLEYKSTSSSSWKTYSGGTVYLIYDVSQGLETVPTEDTRAQGITINLFDYKEQSGDSTFYLGTRISGGDVWTQHGGGVKQGLVNATMQNGYPILNRQDNASLAALFNPDSWENTLRSGNHTVKRTATYPDANHLFQKDKQGYYWYNSAQNYAYYNTEGEEQGNFTVYSEPLTYSEAAADPKFLPFNKVVTDDHSNTGMKLEGSYNYHFGMSVNFDFMMPRNGQINGENMKFEFAGDDDVWVFIDDVLVLDMGGIHDNYNGYIDFGYTDRYGERVGQVWIENVNGQVYTTTIAAMFEKAGKTWNSNDYETHSFDFFYMERGSGGSNCKIRFNLPAVAKNSLLVGKQLQAAEGTSGEIKDYLENSLFYTFQVLKVENGKVTDESMFPNGTEFKVINSEGTEVRTGTIQDGKFQLKADEIAQFAGALNENAGDYIVRETLPNNYKGQYDGVGYEVGSEGGQVDIDGKEDSEFTKYDTNVLHATAASTSVTFTNKVNVSQLSLLSITKELAPGASIDPNTSFSIRVMINDEPLKENTQYTVKAADGSTSTQTVQQAGIITLKGGETASLVDGILVGSKIQVSELDASGTYVPTYTGTCTVNGEPVEGWQLHELTDEETGKVVGVQGDVTKLGSAIAIKISNADYDFSAQLKIEKELLGASGNEPHTFFFQVEQVNSDGTSMAPEKILPGASITTSGGVSNTTLVIGYRSSTVAKGSYYYKISEMLPVEPDGISYDDTYYIVTVQVSGDDNGKTAAVTNVEQYVDGAIEPAYEWNAENGIRFTNYMSGDLSITKTVARTDGQTPSGTGFLFTITLKNGDTPLSGGPTTYTYALTGTTETGTITFTNGVITDVTGPAAPEQESKNCIALDHAETIAIQDLPANASATITETTTDGYAVSWTGATATANDSGVATVTTRPMSDNPAVTCTNTTGAKLPSTGGPGVGLYLTLGSTLTFGAGLLLFLRRRKEGGKAV